MSIEFAITRTSSWYGIAPCEGVSTEMRPYVDVRTVDSPDKLKYPRDPVKEWYARGSNHRLINGQIARDLEPRQVWVVEFETLEDLVKFSKQHGPLVLEVSAEGAAALEIYDDYRE